MQIQCQLVPQAVPSRKGGGYPTCVPGRDPVFRVPFRRARPDPFRVGNCDLQCTGPQIPHRATIRCPLTFLPRFPLSLPYLYESGPACECTGTAPTPAPGPRGILPSRPCSPMPSAGWSNAEGLALRDLAGAITQLAVQLPSEEDTSRLRFFSKENTRFRQITAKSVPNESPLPTFSGSKHSALSQSGSSARGGCAGKGSAAGSGHG